MACDGNALVHAGVCFCNMRDCGALALHCGMWAGIKSLLDWLAWQAQADDAPQKFVPRASLVSSRVDQQYILKTASHWALTHCEPQTCVLHVVGIPAQDAEGS